MDDPYLM